MTVPARFFAQDADGASDRPMCRRPRAALRPMLAFAVVRSWHNAYLSVFFPAADLFSSLSAPLLVFRRRMELRRRFIRMLEYNDLFAPIFSFSAPVFARTHDVRVRAL